MDKHLQKGVALQKGVTLVELLMVVAIIGILLAVAYPLYTDHLRETRRTDAMIALSSAAAAQERWYTVNHAFTSNMANLGGTDSPEGFYSLSVTANSSTFTLTATAKTTEVQASDTGCTSMTIDQLGRKLPSGCW